MSQEQINKVMEMLDKLYLFAIHASAFAEKDFYAYKEAHQILRTAKDTESELLRFLKEAVSRIEIANSEGNNILSAWLPEAKAIIAKAEGKDPA